MSFLPSVTGAAYCGDFRIRVTFNDGTEEVLDFAQWLSGPIFEPLKHGEYFRRFFVEGGAITWPNGADIAPETLYDAATHKAKAKRNHHSADSECARKAQSCFQSLIQGREDFWAMVHDKYKRGDISHDVLIALVDLGLRRTKGSYKKMAQLFHISENDYHRLMDFLRRSKCLLDFRPYRKTP